jgi:hypothetical protein
VSVNKANSGLWGGILNEEPPPAVTKAVTKRLASFNQHKDALLNCLCANGGSAFDATKCWNHLTRLAQVYFLQQVMTPPRERVARLRRLAEVLDQACALAKKATQDDVGCDDLLSTLFRGTLPRDPGGTLVPDGRGSFRVVYLAEFGLKRLVEDLEVYRVAVLRAADDVPTPSAGKPKILPKNYIHVLADVYRANARREPGASRGPFSRFVKTFLVALDGSYKGAHLDSLSEAIKAVRREHGRL